MAKLIIALRCKDAKRGETRKFRVSLDPKDARDWAIRQAKQLSWRKFGLVINEA